MFVKFLAKAVLLERYPQRCPQDGSRLPFMQVPVSQWLIMHLLLHGNQKIGLSGVIHKNVHVYL